MDIFSTTYFCQQSFTKEISGQNQNYEFFVIEVRPSFFRRKYIRIAFMSEASDVGLNNRYRLKTISRYDFFTGSSSSPLALKWVDTIETCPGEVAEAIYKEYEEDVKKKESEKVMSVLLGDFDEEEVSSSRKNNKQLFFDREYEASSKHLSRNLLP